MWTSSLLLGFCELWRVLKFNWLIMTCKYNLNKNSNLTELYKSLPLKITISNRIVLNVTSTIPKEFTLSFSNAVKAAKCVFIYRKCVSVINLLEAEVQLREECYKLFCLPESTWDFIHTHGLSVEPTLMVQTNHLDFYEKKHLLHAVKNCLMM